MQNLQPPIGLMARPSPKQLRDKFKFPSFQSKIHQSLYSPKKSLKAQSLASLQKPYQPSQQLSQSDIDELPDIIKYCRRENIAFTDSEKMYYGISMCRKNHHLYQLCLKECFQSNFQDDLTLAIKQLNKTNQQQEQKSDNIKPQDIVVEKVLELEQYAEDLKQRKLFLKDQQVREDQQKRLIQELSLKIDNPASIEKFRKQTNLHSKTTTKKKKKGKFLERTHEKMMKSKFNLRKDLMKALEKIEIDRPIINSAKANVLIKEDESKMDLSSIAIPSPSKIMNKRMASLDQTGLTVSIDNHNNNKTFSKKLEDSQLLSQLKRYVSKKFELQKQAYHQLLEYIKIRAKNDRDCRVSEQERKIFDTLKVIFQCNWVIQSGVELLGILEEIGIFSDKDLQDELDEQLYFFLWYIFELLNFDANTLDNYLTLTKHYDLQFAQQRKNLVRLIFQSQKAINSDLNAHQVGATNIEFQDFSHGAAAIRQSFKKGQQGALLKSIMNSGGSTSRRKLSTVFDQ